MKKLLILLICLQIISIPVFADDFIHDTFVERTLQGKEPANERIPVRISIIEPVTTKNELHEGQELKFKVLEDVVVGNKKIIKKDSTVNGTLENVSINQGFGVPADILVDKFYIKSTNNKKINLEGNINKIGANRALWVCPAGYVSGFLTLGAGFLLFFVRGGHAKLKTEDVYEVYYIKE